MQVEVHRVPIQEAFAEFGRDVLREHYANDHGVKPSVQLVQDLEHVLGNGGVQIYGAGSRRAKRAAEQRRLFEADQAEPAEPAHAEEAHAMAGDMDEEL